MANPSTKGRPMTTDYISPDNVLVVSFGDDLDADLFQADEVPTR